MKPSEKSELSLSTLLKASLGLTVVFLLIAAAVSRDATVAFDRATLLMFRVPGSPAEPLGPAWFVELVRNVTALGSYPLLMFFTLASVGFLFLDHKWNAACFVLAAVFGGIVLSQGLKLGFARPRPDVVTALAKTFTSSFPSTHAVLSAVVYLTLGALLAQVEAAKRAMKIYVLCLAIFLTLAVGVSRIYLGVHYPTDVLAGWCVGAAWALASWAVALHLQRRRQIEPTLSGD